MNRLFRVICLLGFLVFCFGYSDAHADEIDMSIIAEMESNNNNDAISYRGAKYGRGKYQVSEICLKEYNFYNNTEYVPEDLFRERVCYTVANWYMNKRIPQMLIYYGLPVSSYYQLWAYNAGVGNVVRGLFPAETKKYIAEFNRVGGHNGNGIAVVSN